MSVLSLSPFLPYRWVSLRLMAGGVLLAFGAACASDSSGPSSETLLPADSAAAAPGDSTAPAPSDSTIAPGDSTLAPSDSTSAPPPDSTTVPAGASGLPGIMFGSTDMPKDVLGAVHTGSHIGGALSPSNMLDLLSNARAKGARYVLKMCMGRDQFVKNADGTFSFTKWKAVVDRFKAIDFASYVADGTVLGHYLIDEPSRAERWGGKVISPAELEAMAAYSKQLWPGLPTLVRVVPSWLATSSVTYTHLDAAWFQYAARFGDPATALATEVAAAKSKGLGLMVGMNVLDGGNGSSKLPGWSKGKWKMSAAEVRNYGIPLLTNSYVCGFIMWLWDPTYYGRSDIKSAMTELSDKARAHAKTSCRV